MYLHKYLIKLTAGKRNVKFSNDVPHSKTTYRKRERSVETRKQFANRKLQYLPLVSCLLLLTLNDVSAFNVVPKASYIASLPENVYDGKSAYFGYSVALLHIADFQWLLVGAPRANSSSSPDVFEPGSFFKCPFHNPHQECEEVVLDTTKNFKKHTQTWAYSFRNSSWTGAAIDIDKDKNVVVCAPRWKFARHEEYRITGICYLLGNDLESESAALIAPLVTHDNQIYNFLGKGVFYYAHGESGFDVHVTDNEQLLIGSPGLLNWQGSIINAHRELQTSPGGASKREASHYYVTKNIPNPIHTSKIQDSNYFGYSVASGKFDDEVDVYFIGGAPRGAGSYGMVLIFLIRKFDSQPLFIKEIRQGTQLGEYFGASVAAMDLNSDEYSDLVVGAPLHSFEGLYDAGCVYVFLNNKGKDRRIVDEGIKLVGDRERGARFGTSLGSPGDLDNDGYEDLLVGAPFENEEKGALYIFMGSKYGVREQYAQKLVAEEVSSTHALKGFGISFSRPADLDGNFYPDFAVGSFLSDNAVVMLTRPVILAKGEMSADPPKLLLTHNGFTLTSCIFYEGKGVPHRTDFVARIELRQESLSGDVLSSFSETGNTEEEIILSARALTKTCKNLTVALKLEKSDAQKPVSVKMKFRLKNIEGNSSSDPIMSPFNLFPTSLVLSFITGCKSTACRSDLETLAKFKGFDAHGKLLVGEMAKVTLEVDVLNKGEPAFLSNVTIFISQPVIVLPSLHDCTIEQSFNHTEVVCHLRNPLTSVKKDSLSFDLDVTRMDDTSPDIDVYVRAGTVADVEINPADNNYKLQLKLEKKASLKVTGWSDPEQLTYERLSENEIKTTETETIKHIFSVEKSDETPVRSIGIEIAIPTTLTVNEGEPVNILQELQNELVFHSKLTLCQSSDKSSAEVDPRFQAMKVETERTKKHPLRNMVQNSLQSLNCSVKNINCSYILCSVGPWTKGYDVATITVSFDLNFTILGDFVSVKHGFSLISFVDVRIFSSSASTGLMGKRQDKNTVQTVFQPSPLPVKALAWWIYLLAILGGLLLLVLIAYVLYKIGFFKRKDKEKLKAQKAVFLTSQDQS